MKKKEHWKKKRKNLNKVCKKMKRRNTVKRKRRMRRVSKNHKFR